MSPINLGTQAVGYRGGMEQTTVSRNRRSTVWIVTLLGLAIAVGAAELAVAQQTPGRAVPGRVYFRSTGGPDATLRVGAPELDALAAAAASSLGKEGGLYVLRIVAPLRQAGRNLRIVVRPIQPTPATAWTPERLRLGGDEADLRAHGLGAAQLVVRAHGLIGDEADVWTVGHLRGAECADVASGNEIFGDGIDELVNNENALVTNENVVNRINHPFENLHDLLGDGIDDLVLSRRITAVAALAQGTFALPSGLRAGERLHVVVVSVAADGRARSLGSGNVTLR